MLRIKRGGFKRVQFSRVFRSAKNTHAQQDRNLFSFHFAAALLVAPQRSPPARVDEIY